MTINFDSLPQIPTPTHPQATYIDGCLAAIVGLCYLGQCLGVLGWSTDVDLILVDLYLKTGREEGIEPHYQVRVTFEQVGNTTDHSWCVNAKRERKINQ